MMAAVPEPQGDLSKIAESVDCPLLMTTVFLP
jgi:hypothetical protein